MFLQNLTYLTLECSKNQNSKNTNSVSTNTNSVSTTKPSKNTNTVSTSKDTNDNAVILNQSIIGSHNQYKKKDLLFTIIEKTQGGDIVSAEITTFGGILFLLLSLFLCLLLCLKSNWHRSLYDLNGTIINLNLVYFIINLASNFLVGFYYIFGISRCFHNNSWPIVTWVFICVSFILFFFSLIPYKDLHRWLATNNDTNVHSTVVTFIETLKTIELLFFFLILCFILSSIATKTNVFTIAIFVTIFCIVVICLIWQVYKIFLIEYKTSYHETIESFQLMEEQHESTK